MNTKKFEDSWKESNRKEFSRNWCTISNGEISKYHHQYRFYLPQNIKRFILYFSCQTTFVSVHLNRLIIFCKNPCQNYQHVYCDLNRFTSHLLNQQCSIIILNYHQIFYVIRKHSSKHLWPFPYIWDFHSSTLVSIKCQRLHDTLCHKDHIHIFILLPDAKGHKDDICDQMISRR